MSRRTKRLERKARFVSSLELDKLTLEASIAHAQKAIEEAHGFLAKIEEQKNLLDEYVNKNEDSQIILKKELLNDNTELEILVIQEDRTIIVSTLGFVAKINSFTSPLPILVINSFILISFGPIPLTGEITP